MPSRFIDNITTLAQSLTATTTAVVAAKLCAPVVVASSMAKYGTVVKGVGTLMPVGYTGSAIAACQILAAGSTGWAIGTIALPVGAFVALAVMCAPTPKAPVPIYQQVYHTAWSHMEPFLACIRFP